MSMKDFRLVSLSNIPYKIISKVIANRLKPLWPKIISEEQPTFVEDCSIMDNVLLALEVIHHMRSKSMGKIGEISLKVDISKVFDIVDWNYLLNLSRKMDFHEKWIVWLHLCIQTVQYSVLVNGDFVG